MNTSVSLLIHASRHDLYAACLDPEKLVQWRMPQTMRAEIESFDPRVGGFYRISLIYIDPRDTGLGKTTSTTDSFTGEFLELIPDRRIVEAVVFDSADPAFAGQMIMTTTFEDVEGGTWVTFRCDNIPPGIRPEDNETGCRMALENLARLVEHRGD